MLKKTEKEEKTKNTGTEKTADEIFKEFREISISEFFRKNRTQLGYSGKARNLTTIIHELVTNAIDACEEAEIFPEIEVRVEKIDNEHYKFFCKDNAYGIPKEHIGGVFGKMLAGTKFHRNIQMRGQQGIGVSGITMFCQMTTGKPIKVISMTKTECIEAKIMIDITGNKPVITDEKTCENLNLFGDSTGTIIEGECKEAIYINNESGVFEYLRRTAIANPHAKITFTDPDGKKTIFEKTSGEILKKPKEIKPHPRGINIDDLIRLSKRENISLSSFLIHSLSRVTQDKINELRTLVDADLNKKSNEITWQDAEKIINAFKSIKFLAPSSEGLRTIEEENIKKALTAIVNPEILFVITRKPSVHSGGYAFQIECAICYGGSSGRRTSDGKIKSEIMRFANSVPLLFDNGECLITKGIYDVDWKRYGINDFDNSPVTIFVNVVSTYIPYASAGKQSISFEEEIFKETKYGLMDLGRDIGEYISKKKNAETEKTRLKILKGYAMPCSEAVSILTGKDHTEIFAKFNKVIETKYKNEEKEDEENQDTTNLNNSDNNSNNSDNNSNNSDNNSNNNSDNS
ncbi:MAG: DNA topoisomerase VI subunit B [Candidatus Altiarchaeales archaeon A3]|nr:MAG: DNA topoisomerase VI subunit B [Candidatus Altiarchaeales archaeon A3]